MLLVRPPAVQVRKNRLSDLSGAYNPCGGSGTERIETSLGGAPGAFQSTVWSDILAVAESPTPQTRDLLDRLLRTYWKPVYAYIRAAWRKQVEDAKDLTQAFFTHLLEKDTFARARPERGSFRGFLKTALRNFLVDAERYRNAHAPEVPIVALDAQPEDLARIDALAAPESADEAYEREWIHSLLQDTTQALREKLERKGKSVYFEIFQAYCLDPGDENPDTPPAPTYESLAERFGLRRADVRHFLEYCRQLFREILRARIRDYVTSDGEVDAELKRVLRE